MKVVRSLEDSWKQARLRQLFADIMESGRYSEGVNYEAAEDEITEYIGPAKLVSSCGSALFAAFSYYRKQGHHWAVMQNNTFYATGRMAIEAGIRPILCDSRPDCPSMDLNSLMLAVDQSRVRLVVLTHVGGWLAKDYKRIARYCRQNKIVLMEDCAHAFGVAGAGRLGETACWSFYPTKAVPIGEGGAVSSYNTEVLSFVEKFRNYGKTYRNGQVEYGRGFNLRMSEWDAAVLRVQLEGLPEVLAARRRDAEKLQSIAPCLLEGESNFYKYPVAKKLGEGLRHTGKVYSRSDQLIGCLPNSCKELVPLKNSLAWASRHVCLPVGEGLYDQYSIKEVKESLCKQQ